MTAKVKAAVEFYSMNSDITKKSGNIRRTKIQFLNENITDKYLLNQYTGWQQAVAYEGCGLVCYQDGIKLFNCIGHQQRMCQ